MTSKARSRFPALLALAALVLALCTPVPTPASGPMPSPAAVPIPPPTSPPPTLKPQVRWVPVTGGEDLARETLWACLLEAEAIDGQVVIAGGERGQSRVSQWPHLEVRGGFGITATIEVATADNAAISLHGSLPPLSASEPWLLRRLDVAIASGQARVVVVQGTSAQPSAAGRSFQAGALTGKVQVGVRRVAREFVVIVNGAEVGRLADPGLFADGKVYLGTTVAAKNRLTVHSLAAETVDGQEASVRVVRWPPAVPQRPPGDTLRSLGQARGMLVGSSNLPLWVLTGDPLYRETAGREFSLAGVPVLPALLHPRRDRYNFCRTDAVLAFAQANDMVVYAQPLFIAQDHPDAPLPEWFTQGGLEPEQLRTALREHVLTVVGRYRGQVRYWVVVNEALGVTYAGRPSFLQRTLGPDYIEQLLRWAHEADPNARLCLNENQANGLGPASDALYRLVQDLLRRGAPLQCVGLEMHVSIDPQERSNSVHRFPQPPTSQDVAANMRRLEELGLEVLITEMDVSVGKDATAGQLAAQARVFREVLEVCLAAPNCEAFMTFGVNDRNSWIRTSRFVDRPWEAPLLFDDQYLPKPAYHALRDALRNP